MDDTCLRATLLSSLCERGNETRQNHVQNTNTLCVIVFLTHKANV